MSNNPAHINIHAVITFIALPIFSFLQQQLYIFLFKEKKQEKGRNITEFQEKKINSKKSLVDTLHIVLLEIVIQVTELKHAKWTLKQ